jgi:hypothetical protein
MRVMYELKLVPFKVKVVFKAKVLVAFTVKAFSAKAKTFSSVCREA